jgi:hypothetical protein
MKLLLFIDNISYNKKWGTILNFIKKWFIYYLNNEIILNNIEQLKIIKLFPKTELILDTKNNNMNIENIIKFLSCIIFKNIMSNTDCLSLIDKTIDYDLIIIFSLRKVLYGSNIYEYVEMNHIKNILVFNFDNAKQTPDSMMGSKELIIKKAVKNFYEVFLTNNINNFDKMIETINNRINIINNKFDIIKIDNNLNNLQNLLINLYKIECSIFNNVSKYQPINIEQLLFKLNNYDISGFTNKEYYMFLKYTINFIKTKLTSFYDNKIISNSFNESDKIFKHIFDFYQIVYPKIHHVLKEDNLLLNFKSFDSVNINDIKEKNYDNIIKNNDTSESYLHSIISMSNWKDEIEDLNCFGLLLKYNIKKGKKIKNNKNPNFIKYYNITSEYPNIFVSNISNNFISINDYYQLILNHILPQEGLKKEEVPEFIFNLNDFEIIDSYHGNTNIMLPLYINKEHWYIFNKIKRYHLSLINNYLEPYYNSRMDNIYFFVLLKSFNTMILKNSNDSIYLTIYILRTAMQICIDNKYCLKIKQEYNYYFNNLLSCTELYNFNKIYNDYFVRFIQLIITTKVDVLKIYNDLENVKEHFISINKEYDNCNYLTLHNDLLKLTLFMDNLFIIFGFNQLLKNIDISNGILDNSNLNLTTVKNIISKI